MKRRFELALSIAAVALATAIAPSTSGICGNCRTFGSDLVFCGASPYNAEHCVTRRCINEGPLGLEYSMCCFSLGPCTY